MISTFKKIKDAILSILSDRRKCFFLQNTIAAERVKLENTLSLILKSDACELIPERQSLVVSLYKRINSLLIFVEEFDSEHYFSVINIEKYSLLKKTVGCRLCNRNLRSYETIWPPTSLIISDLEGVEQYLQEYYNQCACGYRVAVKSIFKLVSFCAAAYTMLFFLVVYSKIVWDNNVYVYIDNKLIQRDVTSLNCDLLNNTGEHRFVANNFGKVETHSTEQYNFLWAFGPSASINFISSKQQACLLEIALDNIFTEQHLVVEINGKPALEYSGDGIEKRDESITFIAIPGLNSIVFKFKTWNSEKNPLVASDNRMFAMVFRKLRIESMPFAATKN